MCGWALGKYMHVLLFFPSGFHEFFNHPLCRFIQNHNAEMRGQRSYLDMTVSHGTQHQTYMDGEKKQI